MNLTEYLRNDFATILRPLIIKDKCEVCGTDEELHLHHVYMFSSYLKRCLSYLKLEYKEDIKEYTTKELKNIRDYMMSAQIRGTYKTLCEPCHREEHKKLAEKRKRVNEEYYNSKNLTNLENGIDEKYLGYKMTSELKEEMLSIYGTYKMKWINFSDLISKYGYIIKTDSKGTYVFRKGQEIRKDSKRALNKSNKLIKFLEKYKNDYIRENEIIELVKIINIKKSDGTLQNKPKRINEYLSSIDLDYTILNKPSSGKRRWKIEKRENKKEIYNNDK